MSEYQYYEFQAIDRPLTEPERRRLRGVSSRAVITSTRFTNHYEWGDLKADPRKWMEKYFNAFVYVTNWGTHWFSLRFPASVLDLRTARVYSGDDFVEARSKDGFTILDFASDDENRDYWDAEDDGSGWLASLVALRAEISGGDHRALYLAWLHRVGCGDVDDDETEPPVPAGLGRLTAAHEAFIDFLRIDADLIAAAVEGTAARNAGDDLAGLDGWIATLTGLEKTDLLLEFATGDAAAARADLLRRFRKSGPAPEVAKHPSRTVAELRDRADALAAARRTKQAARAKRDRERPERESAAARARELDRLAAREEAAWREVDELIVSRKPACYDQAVRLLADLQDLAAPDGRADETQGRVLALRERHPKKDTFLRRLDVAGLGRGE